MNKFRTLAVLIDSTGNDPCVERSAPGVAPSAFRIWKAGENQSDDGSIFFTPASATALMAEQEARGRLYSSDFDHLSVIPNRPAESGRASGWHRLQTRPDATGAPELWAVDINWCTDAKAGLEEQPPRWRYFSPAFKTSGDGEVTSYVNFALCINPLTHQLPALAAQMTEKEMGMNKKSLLAALASLKSSASADEKMAAEKCLSEYLDGLDDEDDDKKKKETDVEEPKKDAAGDPPPPPAPDDKKEEPKKDAETEEKTEAKAVSALASDLMKANQKIDQLQINGMLDARPDLSESIRKWCATQSSDTVKTFLHAHPKTNSTRNEKPVQPPTVKNAELPDGPEKAQIERAFGIVHNEHKGPQRLEDGRLVLHTVRPSEFRAMKAAQSKGSAK